MLSKNPEETDKSFQEKKDQMAFKWQIYAGKIFHFGNQYTNWMECKFDT